jgi:hypothetical protein
MYKKKRLINNPSNMYLTKTSSSLSSQLHLTLLPKIIIELPIISCLTPREIIHFSSVNNYFRQFQEPLLKKLEITVSPEIEYMCEIKRCKKLSRQQFKELKKNITNNRHVCGHCHKQDNDRDESNIINNNDEKFERKDLIEIAEKHMKSDITAATTFGSRSIHYEDYLCFCHIRRFIPIIKKTVSGENTIHRYTQRNKNINNNNEQNFEQACHCVTTRPNKLIAQKQPFNYSVCGTYAWYIPSSLSEREQLLKLLEIVKFKLLDPKNGGINNSLILDWLTKVNLLDLFY